ncbi:hypothetical protein D3C77_707360 [compost metagenome]
MPFLIVKSLSALVEPARRMFNPFPSIGSAAAAAQSKGSLKLAGFVNLIVRWFKHASNPCRFMYL